jgi:hypothetical protein
MTLDLEKEQVVQRLCAHYAQDHLSTGELESRFEAVYKAPDRAALLTVLEGLPAVGPLVAPPPQLYSVGPAAVGPGSVGTSERPKRYLAMFSTVAKDGFWRPARRIEARAILGEVRLDLREAEIPFDGLDLDVEAFMGEVKIILPPGIGADVDCTAMMAEVSDKSQAGSYGAPVVRVHGGAVMGTIKVITKLPKKEGLENWRSRIKGWLGSGSWSGGMS